VNAIFVAQKNEDNVENVLRKPSILQTAERSASNKVKRLVKEYSRLDKVR